MCRCAFRERETKRFKTVLYVRGYRYTVLKTDGNGKLVPVMGRHGFPGIFPAKVWHAAAFSCNGSRRESNPHSKQACRPSDSRCPKSAR